MIKKLSLLLFCISVILLVPKVDAEEISYKKIPGVNYNQLVNGKWKTNHVTMFYFGNKIAYCIEPGIDIIGKDYPTYHSWEKTEFTSYQISMFEKIGYYGYEYPTHRTSAYYLAAQELIWNISNPNIEVYWTNDKGEKLSYEKEKQEILALIDKDNVRPSFSDTIISGYLKDEIIINDENKVLSNYTLSESKYHDIKIKDNSLYITLNEKIVPEEEITLTRKTYDSASLIIYAKANSQTLATLRFENPVKTSFKIKNEELVIPEEPKEEQPPEIVKVPNTGLNHSFLPIALILSGLIVRVKKIV